MSAQTLFERFHATPTSSKYLLVIAASIYLMLHIATLNIAPLPWFDEIMFADVTHHFVQTGKMETSIFPLYYKGQVFHYGPMYFLVQSVFIKIFGWSPFAFRLLNLICGLSLVYLLIRLIQRSSSHWLTTLTFGTLILLDTIFNQNLHSGRMDLTAVLFATAALVVADRYHREGRTIDLVFVGITAAFAFLTTPRAVFVLTAPAMLVILKSVQRDEHNERLSIKSVAIAFLFFIAPVLVVLQFTAGLSHYFTSMTSGSTESSGIPMTSFLSGSLLRESYENHAIVLMLAIVLLRYKKVLRHPLLLSVTVGFLSFSIFVKETGPYSAMVMPFVYFVIASLITDLRWQYALAIVAVLLSINLGMFGLRTLSTLSTYKQRTVDSDYYSALKSIPEKSTVLVDDRFFYWCVDRNNTFESYTHSNVPPERYTDHIVNDLSPEYVLIKPGDENLRIFQNQTFNTRYEVTDRLNIPEGKRGRLSEFVRRFVKFDASYECIVYKRKG